MIIRINSEKFICLARIKRTTWTVGDIYSIGDITTTFTIVFMRYLNK